MSRVTRLGQNLYAYSMLLAQKRRPAYQTPHPYSQPHPKTYIHNPDRPAYCLLARTTDCVNNLTSLNPALTRFERLCSLSASLTSTPDTSALNPHPLPFNVLTTGSDQKAPLTLLPTDLPTCDLHVSASVLQSLVLLLLHVLAELWGLGQQPLDGRVRNGPDALLRLDLLDTYLDFSLPYDNRGRGMLLVTSFWLLCPGRKRWRNINNVKEKVIMVETNLLLLLLRLPLPIIIIITMKIILTILIKNVTRK